MVSKEKELNLEISTLTSADLGPVDDLMKGNSQTLGFLPANALGDYLCTGSVSASIRKGWSEHLSQWETSEISADILVVDLDTERLGWGASSQVENHKTRHLHISSCW